METNKIHVHLLWSIKKLGDNEKVPIALKIKIFKISIFLYGCDTWVIGENEKHLINSLATKCFHHILHINQEEHYSGADLDF